ncbi:TadE family type IV pilus minor pilin [Quadrisphaera sp. GCM10027208]|uniref:TadE family type IV pilus minor pilin n=1 Tax=Quadrisphaera sp. GCM10027208 TaxID=3273423 RepID=UPI00360FEBB3
MTAELAVALLGVVTLLGGLFSVGTVALEQVRVTDAARVGARAVARGEPATTVAALSERAAGRPVTVAVGADGDLVRVTVTGRVRLALPGAPSLEVTGTASVPAEQTAVTR